MGLKYRLGFEMPSEVWLAFADINGLSIFFSFEQGLQCAARIVDPHEFHCLWTDKL